MSLKFETQEAGSMDDCLKELTKWCIKWLGMPNNYKVKTVLVSNEKDKRIRIEADIV